MTTNNAPMLFPTRMLDAGAGNGQSSPVAEVGARSVNLSAGTTRGDLQAQWVARPHDERFLSLSALRDSRRELFDASRATTVESKALEFIAPEPTSLEQIHKLSVGLPDGTEVSPTHWSFGQLANRAGAPAGYLRDLPSQIAADCLTWGMRHNREVEEVKTYSGRGLLRAVTGPDYGRIPDHEIVDAVMQIAGDGTGDAPWKVPGVMQPGTGVYDPRAPITIDSTTLYGSDRDVFVFLVDDLHPVQVGKLPDGSPDWLFRGFYVTNSEVGASAVKLATFYLRAVCRNRLMWGVEHFSELTIRHSKHAPSRWMVEALPALNSYAQGSTQRLQDGVQAAKAAEVADSDKAALAWLQGRGLSRKRAGAVLEAVEREEKRPARSIWDMAQGLTAVARDIPHTDDRLQLERQAGALLDKVAA